MTTMIINALDVMVSIPVGLMYLFSLSDEWRYPIKNIKISVGIYLLFLCILDVSIFYHNGILSGAQALVPQINVISCLIYYFMIYKYRDGRFIFIFSSFCNFIFISDTISDVLVQTPGLAHLVIKVLVFIIIGGVVHVFFRPPFLEALNGIKSEWWFLMMVPLTLNFVFAFLIMVPGPLFMNPQFQPPALILCLAVVCIYAAFFSLFSNLKKQYQIEESYHLIQTQVLALTKQVEVAQSMNNQVNLFRHDMRHYMQMQTGCFENEDWDAAKQILDHLNEKIENSFTKHQIYHYTGQIVIDSVLSYIEEKARDSHIELVIRMTAPSECSVNIPEFAVVLSNALENALHACEEMNHKTKRSIQVLGGCTQGKYLLEIMNTYGKPVEFDCDGSPVTRKPNHGYGTRSIKDFASHYNAKLGYLAKNGEFTFRLMIECT